MKSLISFGLFFSLICVAHAAPPSLGQDSDPIGGDGSRCCKTGHCKELSVCKDTAIDADRNSKQFEVPRQRSNQNKKSATANKG